MDIKTPDYEKEGYDAWIGVWIGRGDRPLPLDCDARYMDKSDPRKMPFLKGWLKAQKEFSELGKTVDRNTKIEEDSLTQTQR